MDHAIALIDVGDGYPGLVSLGVDEFQLAIMFFDGQRLAFDGLQSAFPPPIFTLFMRSAAE